MRQESADTLPMSVKPNIQVPVCPLLRPRPPSDFSLLPSDVRLPTFSARIHQSQAPAANPGPLAPWPVGPGFRAILQAEVQRQMPDLLAEISAFSATSAVQIRGADGPDNEGGQQGGVKTLTTWPPSASGLKNALPVAKRWPNVPITKTANRGIKKMAHLAAFSCRPQKRGSACQTRTAVWPAPGRSAANAGYFNSPCPIGSYFTPSLANRNA